jgi:cytochrome P450
LDLEGAKNDLPNFSKTLVNGKDQEGLSKDDVGEMTANLIGGGLDTSSSTLHTCVLALCTFPQAHKSAHAELDRVVGRDRAPEWDDLDRLPYCLALFKETMRWRSVTALGGFAHAPIQDDTYRGYFFPAGIHVYGNLWAIHSNPNDFPDPINSSSHTSGVTARCHSTPQLSDDKTALLSIDVSQDLADHL